MRRFLLLLTFLAAAPAFAQEIDVLITSPPADEPLFGEVEFAAELIADEGAEGNVTRVRFLFDGVEIGVADALPHRLAVDVGGENREHRFEVEVMGESGVLASARLVSPAIATDLEIDAGLQQLYVTVSENGPCKLDLTLADFAIFDNRQRQEVVTFARGDVQLTAALLIDASFSIAGARLRAALGGASTFVREMSGGDDATIWVFSDLLLHQTGLSNNPERLTAGLDRVAAAGGTALNDHLCMALKRLEKQQGRRVVILLSDGIDSHSALRMRGRLAGAPQPGADLLDPYRLRGRARLPLLGLEEPGSVPRRVPAAGGDGGRERRPHRPPGAHRGDRRRLPRDPARAARAATCWATTRARIATTAAGIG